MKINVKLQALQARSIVQGKMWWLEVKGSFNWSSGSKFGEQIIMNGQTFCYFDLWWPVYVLEDCFCMGILIKFGD